MKTLTAYYVQLSSSDQKVLKLLAAFLLGCAVVLGAILPSYHFYIEGKQTLLSNRELLQWMNDNRHNVTTTTTHPVISTADVSLLQLVSASAEEKNITISRLQPEGETRVRLWLNNTGFDAFIQWLQDLNTAHRLDISTISIDQTNTAGVVNVQALVARQN